MKKILTTALAAALLVLAPAAHAQWTRLIPPGPYHLTDITFPAAATGFATGTNPDTQEGVVFRTQDAGATWQQAPTIYESYDLSFTSPIEGFVVSVTGELQKTTDGGSTWQYVTAAGGNIGAMHFYTPLQGILAGWYPGFISTTTDGGQTWQNTQTQSIYDMHFPSPQVGYAVGYEGMVRTLDGGITWDTVTSFGMGNTVFFTSPTTGHWGSTTAQIARTTDGGQTWDFWQDGAGSFNQLNDIYFPDPLNGYAVGGMGVILKTTDGGITWTESPSGTTQNLRSVYCTDASTCYSAGDSSLILKTTTGGVLAAAEDVGPVKALQLYPNPATGTIVLQLEQQASTHAAVMQLHDVTGKLVLEHTLALTATARQEVQLPTLPAGLYTARVVSPDAVYMAKLVLQ